jgi:hypothetical protein
MKIPPNLEIERVAVYPLNPSDLNMGWEAFTFLKGNTEVPIGGGYAITKELAQTISLSEAIERMLFESKLQNSNRTELADWGLDINKTTSGLAFGSSPHAVMQRSLCEAYEHFVRYHGIYRGLKLAEYIQKNDDSKVINFLKTFFTNVKYYYHSDQLKINSEILTLHCLIVLAEKNNGVFLGAKCSLENAHNLIQSSLIEALRNLRLFENYLSKKTKDELKKDIEERVFIAGVDSSNVFKNVNSSNEAWNMPKIRILKIEEIESCDGFLGRTLIEGVPAWYDLKSDKLI